MLLYFGNAVLIRQIYTTDKGTSRQQSTFFRAGQHGVLCKQGLTFKLRLFAYPSFGFGGRNSADFCWLTSAFSYKFSFSSGQAVGQFPTCTKPGA